MSTPGQNMKQRATITYTYYYKKEIHKKGDLVAKKVRRAYNESFRNSSFRVHRAFQSNNCRNFNKIITGLFHLIQLGIFTQQFQCSSEDTKLLKADINEYEPTQTTGTKNQEKNVRKLNGYQTARIIALKIKTNFRHTGSLC